MLVCKMFPTIDQNNIYLNKPLESNENFSRDEAKSGTNEILFSIKIDCN